MTAAPDIESAANPRVKAWASLAKRSERDATRTFLIEGDREVVRSAPYVDVAELILCPEYGGESELDRVHTTTVSKRVFDKISHRQNPDGVAAVALTPKMGLDRLDVARDRLVLVADGVEKPGNVGAMLRSCDAFGAAFIASSLGTDLVNPNVIRAAQGSLFTTMVASADRADVIAWCSANTTIFVADPSGPATVWDIDFTRPTTVVIGSEHTGVDPAWLAVGTPTLIPMAGTADSLNASVSAGVFLAEAARQRSG